MSELEKMRIAQGQASTLSEFVDWLGENGYAVCKWHEHVRYSDDLGDYSPAGWFPKRESYEELFANFFLIDLKKVDKERAALLESIRQS